MPVELNTLTASEIARRMHLGEISALAVAQACLDRVSDRDQVIKAWSFVDRMRVLDAARELDKRPDYCPLRGIPFGIKDVIDTGDQPTGYNSAIYAGHQPKADAASVTLLKRAGASILGKTVTTEFANIHPVGTRNPLDIRYSPGGSSSGSAAAVADFMVPVALGTQTAGSIIRPAAYCGIFAIKPTFGSINRAGLKFLAESLDTIGIFSRAPEDLALVLQVMSGRQPISIPNGSKPRIGICRLRQWGKTDTATEINLAVASETLARAGAIVTSFDLPDSAAVLAERHKSVMGFESARALAWEMDAFPGLISDALRVRLEDGLRVSREEYDDVRNLATIARQMLTQEMRNFDFLLTPSAPGEAPLFANGTGDSMFNRAWTLLGMPCLTVPFGKGPAGLPLGLQLVGGFEDDMKLIAWAEWVNTAMRGQQ